MDVEANERLVLGHWTRSYLPGPAIHVGCYDVPQGALGSRPDRFHPADPVAHRRGPAGQAPALPPLTLPAGPARHRAVRPPWARGHRPCSGVTRPVAAASWRAW